VKKTWIVYGIFVDGVLRYIGKTGEPIYRRGAHRCGRFHGKPFEMRTLRQCRSEAHALRVERAMIEAEQPPDNKQHRPERSFQRIQTWRPGANGIRLEVSMSLHDGMMHPDQARKVWFSRKHRTSGEAASHMPGWTPDRAAYMFGPRTTRQS
jgi:hypothetical protein